MTVSVLSDNNPGTNTAAEHGLSYLLEHDGKKILFDTGQSGLFMTNAGIMRADLKNIDAVILSHGHYDHGNGLKHLSGTTLICHPGCFRKRYNKSRKKNIGLSSDISELSASFTLITSAEPYRVSPRIIFLGEIPRNTSFESKQTSFRLEDGSEDFVMDDSAVALLLEEGLFVITGCGHAGIVNTLEHAKDISGEKNISGIMGGFHLKHDDHKTRQTIKYLADNNVKHVKPSHCTALPALAAFYSAFGIKTVKTGDIYKFGE
mgnify:CR=1 FL=1